VHLRRLTSTTIDIPGGPSGRPFYFVGRFVPREAAFHHLGGRHQMAKPTRHDMRFIRYLAREFGIDRHSDFQLARAFIFSVGRVALKELRQQDAVTPSVVRWNDRDFPIDGMLNGAFDGETWAIQRARYYALRNGPLIRHVVDWLDVSVREEHAWPSNLDALGRPKKIMKCGSIDSLFNEAERQLSRQRQRTVHATEPLTSDDLRWVCDLDHGLRLVQLLSPEALDDEGHRMKHCIGLGSYDRRLDDPDVGYYSVRDGDERSLATIEVERAVVHQFVGPENGKPRLDVAIAVGNLMCKVGWMHWIEVYEKDVEAFGEYHKLCRLLAMPYHVGAMERFRMSTAEHKVAEVARLRAAAGLGPDDAIPEPPTPAFEGIENVTYEEIVIGEDGEPMALCIDRETFLGGP